MRYLQMSVDELSVNDYTIVILHRLLIYTSKIHSLVLHSLDTLSDVRIKVVTLLSLLRRCLFQTQA
jgi:hypothetical protein